MNQVSRNAKYRQNKGLTTFTALVRPSAKELFAEIRRRNTITAADLFDSMLEAYQRQGVIRLQQEPEPVTILQPESESVITLREDQQQVTAATESKADQAVITLQTEEIDTSMPVKDRRQFSINLLTLHGGDKDSAMTELRDRLKAQFPGFTSNREANRTGQYAEPQKFYSAVSDFLVRLIKIGK